MWTEWTRKLESHGNKFGLEPLYKVIALKKLTVGRAKEHFDIWEAEHKHESDCGFIKCLDKVREYSRKAKLDSTATYKNNDDDMDTGHVKKQDDIKKKNEK